MLSLSIHFTDVLFACSREHVLENGERSPRTYHSLITTTRRGFYLFDGGSDKRTASTWIFEPRKIAYHYCSSFFFPLDVLSIGVAVFDWLELDFVVEAMYGPGPANTSSLENSEYRSTSSLKALRVLRALRLIKLVRLLRASRMLQRWEVRAPERWPCAHAVQASSRRAHCRAFPPTLGGSQVRMVLLGGGWSTINAVCAALAAGALPHQLRIPVDAAERRQGPASGPLLGL